jgi:hypothetical protein
MDGTMTSSNGACRRLTVAGTLLALTCLALLSILATRLPIKQRLREGGEISYLFPDSLRRPRLSSSRPDPTVRQQLKEHGLTESSGLRISLAWLNRNDLDLAIYLIAPTGEARRVDAFQRFTSEGLYLERDFNYTTLTPEGRAHYSQGLVIGREHVSPMDGSNTSPGFGDQSARPIENIIWPNPKHGYKVRVLVSHYWNRERATSTSYTVEVKNGTHYTSFQGVMGRDNEVENGPGSSEFVVDEFTVGDEQPPKGGLYLCDARGVLFKYDIATASVKSVGQSGTTLTDIAYGADGWIYAVDSNNLFFRLDPVTTKLTRIALLPSSANSLVSAENGDFLAAGGDRIFTISPSGETQSLLNIAPYTSAGDLAFGADKKLYLTTIEGKLLRLHPESRRFEVVGDIDVAQPFGLATDPDTRKTYVFSHSAREAFEIDTKTGKTRKLSSFAKAGLAGCTGATYVGESALSSELRKPISLLAYLIAAVWMAALSLILFFGLRLTSVRFLLIPAARNQKPTTTLEHAFPQSSAWWRPLLQPIVGGTLAGAAAQFVFASLGGASLGALTATLISIIGLGLAVSKLPYLHRPGVIPLAVAGSALVALFHPALLGNDIIFRTLLTIMCGSLIGFLMLLPVIEDLGSTLQRTTLTRSSFRRNIVQTRSKLERATLERSWLRRR